MNVDELSSQFSPYVELSTVNLHCNPITCDIKVYSAKPG